MIAKAPSPEGDAGLYVHFPFCAIRCTYCDFPTVAGRDDRIESYLQALTREIERFQQDLPSRIDTVFLGGGTPSRMSPGQVERVLGTIRRRFDVKDGAEITLEGNPESLTADRLQGYRDAGVNRISIGLQSLDDRVLEKVGRAHRAVDGLRAIREARDAFGLSLNVDLIIGLPGEKLDRWPETVAAVAELSPGHVSVYLLETDKQTPLARSILSGRTLLAEDEQIVAAYRATVEVLERSEIRLYEISNFARPGRESRHNMKYWTDRWFGGFGLGAHAYYQGRRRGNRRDLDGYLDDLGAGRDPVAFRDPWDGQRRIEEVLMQGLRLVEGLDIEQLSRRYEVDLRHDYAEELRQAEERGMLEWDGSRARLTPHGRLFSDELFRELIR